MTNQQPKQVPSRTIVKRAATRQESEKSQVSLTSNFKLALAETRACDPELTARVHLLFRLVTESCRPVIAVFTGEVQSRPFTLFHHDPSLNELQAIECRQDLIDDILSQLREEATSRTFLKRYHGRQLAVIAVPCKGGSCPAPFGGLAIAVTANRSLEIREQMQFVEALAMLTLDFDEPQQQADQAAHDDFDRLAKAASSDNELALAYQIVNAIAGKFSCEQVALGVKSNQKSKLVAVSGTATVKRNSPGSIILENAMDECLDQREIVAYPHLKSRPSTVGNGLHQTLSKTSGQATVCSIPINCGDHCVGVITMRRASGDSFSDEELQRLDAKLVPCGPALQLLERASRSLVSHAKDSLRDNFQSVISSHTKISILIFTTLLLSWIFFGRMTYKPSCNAELAAAVPQHISAPLDGIVRKVYVNAGQSIQAGQPLLDFDTSAMLLEQRMLEADIGEATVDLKNAISDDDPKAASLQQAKIAAIQAKLQGVVSRINQATIVAPSTGSVVRCELDNKIGQEFKFGMPLMELAIGDDWRIEIQIPDTVAPYVAAGQTGHFAPLGRPGESYPFTIRSVSGRAAVKEGANVFTAQADLHLTDEQAIAWMKVGLSGVAKIESERRPVYWVLFHDILDWFHKSVWY